MTNHRSDTETIIAALDILAREIHSEDGVANAAIAEGAQRLREMQRKVDEFRQRKQKAESRERNAWLLRHSEARQFSEELDRLRAEVEALRAACTKQNYEICQTLGAALGYPRFCDDRVNFPAATEADGVCVFEHVAETLAAEAADKLRELAAEN